MNRKQTDEHQHIVYEFMKECEANDPEKYKSVCEKYPVITMKRWRVIQSKEESIADDMQGD